MGTFSNFLKINGIRQVDIVSYLNISKAYVHQLVTGERKLSADKIELLKQNPDWDCSILESELYETVKQISGRDSNIVNGNVEQKNCEVVAKLYDIIDRQQKQIDRMFDLLEKKLDDAK